MTFLFDSAGHAWAMLVEAAPYIWLGLLAAGALHAWVPQEWILAQLGGRGQASVWKAALLGVPLPLCSCGVIPTTVGLRKKGAGRGATLSFLISTPETSVDSVALTWALLGPVWAVIRPVAAVGIAVFTGSVANLFRDDYRSPGEPESCGCGCNDHGAPSPGKPRRAGRFVFKELLPDIGGWLLLGIVLSGFVLALLPPGFLEALPGGAWAQIVLALVVGVPLYICAAASTPLAAALLMKGLAPGAALVLLLAGPATNLASALVISRQLGRLGTMVYFGGVAVGSLVAGILVQLLAPAWHLGDVQMHTEWLPAWARTTLAITLLVAIVIPWLLGRLKQWSGRTSQSTASEAEPGSPSKGQAQVHK